MAGEIGTAYVAVKLDPTGIRQGMATAEAETTKQAGFAGDRAGQAFSKGMKVGLVGLAAVGVGMFKAVSAASDLNEEVNKTSVVFGDSADSMLEWSKHSATAMGLSQQEALAAAGAYGNMFKTIGFGDQQAGKMSRTMAQLAGDMASFHNQDPTDMLDKLRSGLSGEAEPLRQFGILISDARVKQFAYQNGIAKTGKELTEAQKVQARYGLILQDSTKAQGDFARTSDGAANQQRIMRAEVKDLTANLGTALLPAYQDVLGVATNLVGMLSEHKTATKVLVGVVAGFSAVLVAAGAAQKVYAFWTAFSTKGTIQYAIAQKAARAATIAQTAAQWLLNAAMSANPIMLVVIGLAALAVAFVVAYKKSETFRNVVNGVFEWLKGAVSTVIGFVRKHWLTIVGIMLGPVGIVATQIIQHWDAIKNAAGQLVGRIRGAFSDVAAYLRGLPSKMLELGKSIGSAIVNGILDAFRDIGQRIRDLIPDVGSLVPDLPGPLSFAPPATGAAAATAGPLEAGVGVSPLAGGAGGLSGPVPFGQRLRRQLRGARPAVVTVAPARVALTITNWEDGAGYLETAADRSVASAGRLVETKRRMVRA